MDKYLEKVRDAEEAIAGEIVEDHLAAYSEQERIDAATLLGRAQAADRISVALSAEVIRFIEHFERTKRYRALGHPDFVTFLKHSGLNSVTKSRYYERKKILDKEGDPVFDALTIAGVPITVRGYLEPGEVTIEGESIVVKGDDDSSDIVIHKDDHQSIVTALRNQAQIRRTAAKELAKVKDKLAEVKARHDAEKRELYDENERLRASKMAEVNADAHMMAVIEVKLAFKRLEDEAAKLSPVEQEQFRHRTLEDLAYCMQSLSESYGSSPDWARHAPSPDLPANVAPGSDDEWFAQKLAEVNTAPDDNDAELAAAMS